MGTPLDPRVLDSIDLAQHNEGTLALENLVENLDEYEIAVSDAERAGLLHFADTWHLDTDHRRYITELPSA